MFGVRGVPRIAACAVALAPFAWLACSPNSDPGGGAPATGGISNSATGGATGGSAARDTGGAPATGGTATGSGGAGTSSGGLVATGGAGTGGAGTGGSSAATSGGVSTGGTVGSGGTSGESAGASGGASPGGGGATNGGAPTGGAAGANAGIGGSNGGHAASGGSAGTSGGGVSNDRTAAQVLDGFAILKPCVSSFKPSGANNNGDCCCEELAANENQHISKQFGGDANVTYNVKLRIAGVAERYWYAGGTLDATSKIFYTRGLPTIHSASAPNNNLRPGQGACKIHPPDTDRDFAIAFTVPVEVRPSDGCYNGFNIFALTVSSPKQSYYLNYTTDFDGSDRQPHSVYKTDYTVTIPIKGQASLDFYTIDGDHHQVTNNGTMSVPNVKTMQPYNGNFLEFTVLDVSRAD
jgi:hypothetical protein